MGLAPEILGVAMGGKQLEAHNMKVKPCVVLGEGLGPAAREPRHGVISSNAAACAFLSVIWEPSRETDPARTSCYAAMDGCHWW